MSKNPNEFVSAIMQSDRDLWLFFLLLFLCSNANICIPGQKDQAQEAKASYKSRWAIVALVDHRTQSLKNTRQRNIDIAEKIRPYAHQHNISVLFFSECIMRSEVVRGWEGTFEGLATVRYINTARHGFHLQEKFGYKYMCKFFSLDMYDHLADEYDYYMRVDTDCYLKKLEYDIFQWAEDKKVEYSFALRRIEGHQLTRETLPKWSIDYMHSCGINNASALMDVPFEQCVNFYNNWHIGKVSFFTRPDVKNYLTSVNASGGIQNHRWGDSTIQAYAVRLFMDPRHLIQVPGFAYVHGSHDAFVTTDEDGAASTVPDRLPNWSSMAGGS